MPPFTARLALAQLVGNGRVFRSREKILIITNIIFLLLHVLIITTNFFLKLVYCLLRRRFPMFPGRLFVGNFVAL